MSNEAEMDMRPTLTKIAESLEGRFSVSLESLTEHVSVLAEEPASYYVRVVQVDRESAWSSPIWVGSSREGNAG